MELERLGGELDRLAQQRVEAAKPGVWDLSSLGARLASQPTPDATLRALERHLSSCATSALASLSLSGNGLDRLPTDALPASLTMIDLGHNPLSPEAAALSGLAANLPALQAIGLAGVDLRCVPRSLAACAGLRSLDLSANPRCAWDGRGTATHCLPAGLTRLSLADNELRTVPCAVWRLETLETLELHNNQLAELRDEIQTMRALRVLRLGNNALVALPSQLGRCEQLAQLGILGNPIGWPPKAVLALKMPKLLEYLRGEQDAERGLAPCSADDERRAAAAEAAAATQAQHDEAAAVAARHDEAAAASSSSGDGAAEAERVFVDASGALEEAQCQLDAVRSRLNEGFGIAAAEAAVAELRAQVVAMEKGQISELKGMTSPPKPVWLTLQALAALLGDAPLVQLLQLGEKTSPPSPHRRCSLSARATPAPPPIPTLCQPPMSHAPSRESSPRSSRPSPTVGSQRSPTATGAGPSTAQASAAATDTHARLLLEAHSRTSSPAAIADVGLMANADQMLRCRSSLDGSVQFARAVEATELLQPPPQPRRSLSPCMTAAGSLSSRSRLPTDLTGGGVVACTPRQQRSPALSSASLSPGLTPAQLSPQSSGSLRGPSPKQPPRPQYLDGNKSPIPRLELRRRSTAAGSLRVEVVMDGDVAAAAVAEPADDERISGSLTSRRRSSSVAVGASHGGATFSRKWEIARGILQKGLQASVRRANAEEISAGLVEQARAVDEAPPLCGLSTLSGPSGPLACPGVATLHGERRDQPPPAR